MNPRPEELAETVYSVDEFLLRCGKSGATDDGVRRWVKDERVNRELREVLEHLNHTTEVEKDRTTARRMPEYGGNIFALAEFPGAQEEIAKLKNARLFRDAARVLRSLPFPVFRRQSAASEGRQRAGWD